MKREGRLLCFRDKGAAFDGNLFGIHINQRGDNLDNIEVVMIHRVSSTGIQKASGEALTRPLGREENISTSDYGVKNCCVAERLRTLSAFALR